MSHQCDLLASAATAAGPQAIVAPGLALRFWPAWLEQPETWMARLLEEVPWKQERIRLYGRSHPLPRLTCGMGDPGCPYRYSGVANPLEPWSPAAAQLRERLEALLEQPFNALLLNLYRDGADRMGWHADDERELDPAASIASLSLGQPRCFRLRPRPGASPGRAPCNDNGNSINAPIQFDLGDGDLLVMDPPTQRHWQHGLPARSRLRRPRLNLTFRRVRPAAAASG